MANLHQNLALGHKIMGFIKNTLKMTRSNASAKATFVEDLSCGLAARSVDPAGYMQYQALLPKHLAMQAKIDAEKDHYFTQNINRLPAPLHLDPNKEQALVIFREFAFKLIGLKISLDLKPDPYGGCTEFCNVVVAILLLKKVPFEVFAAQCPTTGFDHQFIVLGRKLDSDLRNIASWGNDAVILDPWDLFKCVSAREALFKPTQHPFFAIKHRSAWRWWIMLSYPVQYPAITTPALKQFLEQKCQALMTTHIPSTFNLPETTTNIQDLLVVCNFSQKSSADSILASAIQHSQYDFYRLEFTRDAHPDMDMAYLENMSYVFGNGNTRKLICINREKVSINRLWFEQQLSIENRRQIVSNANLPLPKT